MKNNEWYIKHAINPGDVDREVLFLTSFGADDILENLVFGHIYVGL